MSPYQIQIILAYNQARQSGFEGLAESFKMMLMEDV